ncbi:basic proline-rich protein-like [Ammospiza nelsoni]|uniref:basic proline-rich protein-like n=1 Tax=Ammospiza nelsoni TaxID=2857394 RepID=UPI00286BFBAA|nr:basic proline-rich protein-like [Ammospiza nelsoni]
MLLRNEPGGAAWTPQPPNIALGSLGLPRPPPARRGDSAAPRQPPQTPLQRGCRRLLAPSPPPRHPRPPTFDLPQSRRERGGAALSPPRPLALHVPPVSQRTPPTHPQRRDPRNEGPAPAATPDSIKPARNASEGAGASPSGGPGGERGGPAGGVPREWGWGRGALGVIGLVSLRVKPLLRAGGAGAALRDPRAGAEPRGGPSPAPAGAKALPALRADGAKEISAVPQPYRRRIAARARARRRKSSPCPPSAPSPPPVGTGSPGGAGGRGDTPGGTGPHRDAWGRGRAVPSRAGLCPAGTGSAGAGARRGLPALGGARPHLRPRIFSLFLKSRDKCQTALPLLIPAPSRPRFPPGAAAADSGPAGLPPAPRGPPRAPQTAVPSGGATCGSSVPAALQCQPQRWAVPVLAALSHGVSRPCHPRSVPRATLSPLGRAVPTVRDRGHGGVWWLSVAPRVRLEAPGAPCGLAVPAAVPQSCPCLPLGYPHPQQGCSLCPPGSAAPPVTALLSPLPAGPVPHPCQQLLASHGGFPEVSTPGDGGGGTRSARGPPALHTQGKATPRPLPAEAPRCPRSR